MSGRKMYEGEKYSFIKSKRIGKGGNGAVYDVKIAEIDYPVVAKFFEYTGSDKETRYKRFKQEVDFVCNIGESDGIIPILDKKCPEGIPKTKDEAWFLMPKAETYKVNRRRKIVDKIDDMLRLANIIRILHKKNSGRKNFSATVFKNLIVLSCNFSYI